MSTTPANEMPATGVRWTRVNDVDELYAMARQRILGAAARTIELRGEFLLVLAGGETPRGLYRLMRTANTDWSHWHVYFSDERCLPPTDPARNSRMAADQWLDHVAIPHDHVHTIAAELGAIAGALAAVERLRSVREFDFVLLGLGEDGHTASLFPGHEWGLAADAPDALAVIDAPKSPRERVSLSAARLSRAHEVMFLVAGESKRDAVARWRAQETIPAAAIRPARGVDVLVESALLAAATR